MAALREGAVRTSWLLGVTRNRLDEIVENEVQWASILLVGTPDAGYFLSGLTVLHRSARKWTLGGDGDYKVNENRDVEVRERFSSVGECMERLVAAGPRGSATLDRPGNG